MYKDPLQTAILESLILFRIAIPLGVRDAILPNGITILALYLMKKKVEGDSESLLAILRIVNRVPDSRFAESTCVRALRSMSGFCILLIDLGMRRSYLARASLFTSSDREHLVPKHFGYQLSYV